jgi:hypothetical protein
VAAGQEAALVRDLCGGATLKDLGAVDAYYLAGEGADGQAAALVVIAAGHQAERAGAYHQVSQAVLYLVASLCQWLGQFSKALGRPAFYRGEHPR